ncbi:flagellar hook protein [Buchnera aphidicola (Diuraphis noxia)]|uniref:Flagellar hook-associated protein 1 n=1 Tax=Buchnera aphidicola subsp. Diuraphis noxia TaxID=118101 RepID=A0A1B2H8J2_BUCDN|nr:flagellar hook protein [Buchnera aphidicola]ANZ22551.1 flagellar hook protein [Buchnera aphidicola (Diuraphis noxia)]
MSSIFNLAIAGINAMKIMIDNTTDKINHPNQENIARRIFIENTVQNSNLDHSVKVKEIYDRYNDFITEERRKTQAQVQDDQTQIEQLLKLEDLLCEKSSIFNKVLKMLYQTIYKHIGFKNIILRQDQFENYLKESEIEQEAKKLVLEINNFDKKLNFLEEDIKKNIMNNIIRANELIDKIHDATIDIRYFPVKELPNRIDSFIDKRDHLVDELNDLIGIKVVKGNDSYKIYLNNGICIIDNNHKQNLIPLISKSDEKYISIGYIDENENKVKKIENMVSNSILGALFKFKREDLTNTRNKISQLTVKFSHIIDSHFLLGYDIFSHFGKKLFNISQPEVIPSSTNRSSPMTSVKWIDKGSAKDTDYIIYFKNNNWIITKLSDRTIVSPFIHHLDNGSVFITFDGIEFAVTAENTDGNIYMIKPYSNTLKEFQVLVDSTYVNLLHNNNIDNIQKNPDFFMKNITTYFTEESSSDDTETLDQSYQKFSKSITHKCKSLEEKIPFKKNMIRILHDKKASMFNNMEQNYENLNFQQEAYLANVRVLQVAEKIFNEIIECYS